MQRLGMRRAPDDDFLHPLIAPGHLLQPHVVYRQKQGDWRPPGDMKK
jgi:hypothetical protein